MMMLHNFVQKKLFTDGIQIMLLCWMLWKHLTTCDLCKQDRQRPGWSKTVCGGRSQNRCRTEWKRDKAKVQNLQQNYFLAIFLCFHSWALNFNCVLTSTYNITDFMLNYAW